MKRLIEYFSEKHILTNLFVVATLIGAVYFWNSTRKEELPNIDYDVVRVSASYPGATAENMDSLVTRNIENALDGIDGIISVSSTSGLGSASLSVELDPKSPARSHVVSDISDAVAAVDYPETMDLPRVMEFKSSRFSVLDLAISCRDVDVMSDAQRQVLQDMTDLLADRIKRVGGVSEVGYNAYLNKFVEINVRPEMLVNYDITLQEITQALKKSIINQPIGALSDQALTKIKLESEVTDPAQLNNIIVRSNFEGNMIRLRDLASVESKFENRNNIYKVDGNEAVVLRVTKSSGSGIIEVVDRINNVTAEFAKTVLAGNGIVLRTLQDQSTGVRNRLSIISSNGLMGFILVVLVLFALLDAKSSFWVAMSIPFTMAATMIIAPFFGQTINNMTLAAVIIVMGMIVDNGIVVAENAARLRHSGLSLHRSVVQGTSEVVSPIVASIATTCVAFIPLYFFQGRQGALAAFLPPVIFIMLGMCLFQSIFILPSHLLLKFGKRGKSIKDPGPVAEHWFMKVEHAYGRLLEHLLRHKIVVFAVLVLMLVYSGFIFMTQMKFTMFPREETTQIFVSGSLPADTDKYTTEKAIRSIEEFFIPMIGKDVVGVTSRVARSRHGGVIMENEFTVSVEVVERNMRSRSNSQLTAAWDPEMKKLPGFDTIMVGSSRFGQSSGSAVDVIIQETDDATRKKVADEIAAYMARMPSLKNPVVETQLVFPQEVLSINRELAERLGVNIATLAQALRTIISGDTIYTLIKDEKETDIILTVDASMKRNISSVLSMPVPNQAGNLIRLGDIVSVRRGTTPDTIIKLDGRRTQHVYADLTTQETAAQSSGQARDASAPASAGEKISLPQIMTPLEIADHLEKNLFPGLYAKYPTASILFHGEIADSRKSGNDFVLAMLLALLLVYIILVFTLNSLTKPFIILLSIPFGIVGVILTFQIHGIMVYGFFAAVGILGLGGVVVNDAIVLMDKLEREYDNPVHGKTIIQRVANITKLRLRAVTLTTVTTVVGLLPTAYGIAGYDSLLADMMLAMAWGLLFSMVITLVMVPALYCLAREMKHRPAKKRETA